MEPEKCKSCGAEAVSGFATPLCAPCRHRFTHGTLPTRIKVFIVALFCIGIAGFVFRSGNLRAAHVYERGKAAEEGGNYYDALEKFEKALEYFPSSPKIILRVATCQERLGQKREAIETLRLLSNRKLNKHLVKEADVLIDRIQEGK